MACDHCEMKAAYIDELETTVKSLRGVVNEKNLQIETLKKTLEGTKIELARHFRENIEGVSKRHELLRLVDELKFALRAVFEISEVEGAVNLTTMESAQLMAARDLVPKDEVKR